MTAHLLTSNSRFSNDLLEKVKALVGAEEKPDYARLGGSRPRAKAEDLDILLALPAHELSANAEGKGHYTKYVREGKLS